MNASQTLIIQQQQQQQQRRIELQVERDHSQTQLSLALSPVLTSGYYSESLSQSVSQSLSSARRAGRRSTPPPAPLAPRDEGVVIQAGMTFVLGHKTVRSASVSAIGTQASNGRRTGVRQHFRPLPAHTMAETTSSALTRAIRDFLGRTDHVINEWNQTGKSGQRSRSSTRSCCQPATQRRFSTRSLSSSRYSSSETPSSSEPRPLHFSRAPSFQSIRSLQSTADTDFDSCQDLNDYEEVFYFLFH